MELINFIVENVYYICIGGLSIAGMITYLLLMPYKKVSKKIDYRIGALHQS